MKTIRAILFDVVGTTVLEDDPDLINSSFLKAFEQHSIYVDKATVLKIRGRDKHEAIQEILSSHEKSAILNTKIFRTFEQNVVDRLSDFHEHPEFSDLVSFLHDRGIIIGVGSGLPQSIFEKLFNHLNWKRYSLDYVSTFDKFESGRPEPHMINDMCERCNVGKDEFLKVGDTVSDIKEGQAAGVCTGVIFSGTQQKEILIAAGPTYFFESLADVKRLL